PDGLISLWSSVWLHNCAKRWIVDCFQPVSPIIFSVYIKSCQSYYHRNLPACSMAIYGVGIIFMIRKAERYFTIRQCITDTERWSWPLPIYSAALLRLFIKRMK